MIYFLHCYISENVFILPFYVISLPGYASYVLIFSQYFRDFTPLFPVRCLISLKAFSILFLILYTVMKCHYYIPGIVFVFVFPFTLALSSALRDFPLFL